MDANHSNVDARLSVMLQNRWVSASIILAVFLLVDHLHEVLSFFEAYAWLREEYPFYVRSGVRNLLQILICLAAVRIFWASSASETIRELGFVRRLPQGLAFGVAATAPMFIGFALTSPLASPPVSVNTAYLAGVSPLTEEIIFRGFACGLLYTRARMPAWMAICLPGIIFGWGHVEQGAAVLEQLGLFFLIGFGGIVFGWFYLRWLQNIWVPFAVHALGNLSWEMFDVADTALGGWFPLTLQLVMILLGIVITLRWTKAIRRNMGAS